LVFLASVMMFGCGGGGGDDDGGAAPQPAPTVPDVVNYSIGTSSTPLNAILQPGGITFSLVSVNLAGTLNRVNADLTMSENHSMSFTMPSPFIAGETLSIGILIPSGGGIVSPGNQQYPASGALQINVSSGVTEAFDRVMGEVITTGVRIEAFDGPDSVAGPTTLTWQQFEALENDPTAEEYLRVARYAYSALEFVFEQFSLTYLLLATVVENDDLLQSNRSIVGAGDVFPGTGRAGTLQIDWQDASSNADLGPGDTFVGTFSEFWVDDSNDDIDRMYNGVLRLTGYIENQGAINNVGGNFVFNNFEEQETKNNVISPDTTTVNGGFSVLFSW